MTSKFVYIRKKIGFRVRAIKYKGGVYGDKDLFKMIEKLVKEKGAEKVKEEYGYEYIVEDRIPTYNPILDKDIYKEFLNRNLNIFEYIYYNDEHKKDIIDFTRCVLLRIVLPVLYEHIMKQVTSVFKSLNIDISEVQKEAEKIKIVDCKSELREVLESISELVNRILDDYIASVDRRKLGDVFWYVNIASSDEDEGRVYKWRKWGKFVVIERDRWIADKYLFDWLLIPKKLYTVAMDCEYIIEIRKDGKVSYTEPVAIPNIINYIYSYSWKFDKRVIEDAVKTYLKYLVNVNDVVEMLKPLIDYWKEISDMKGLNTEVKFKVGNVEYDSGKIRINGKVLLVISSYSIIVRALKDVDLIAKNMDDIIRALKGVMLYNI